jgi:hypothetical protein
MRFKNFLMILSSVLLLVFPPIGLATIVFEDNFDAEPDEPWIYNYDSFANWDVTEGVVDLISSGHPGFEAFTVNGMFIDLDGSSPSLGAGRMETKNIFEFLPGYTYRLEFELAGSQASWSSHPNTVSVSLGDIYNQDITLDTFEPFQTFQHVFDVTSPTSAKLIFDHWGHGWASS